MSGDLSKNTKVEFVVFDLDGVLADTVSSWVWVHNHYGVNNDISHEKYKRNEIDDDEFMRSDIALWHSKKQRIHISEIREILAGVPLMPGFYETMEILKYFNITPAIVSSGLEPLAERVGHLGNIPYILANGLELDKNGYLTGEGILNVALRRKGEPVKQLIKDLGFPKPATVAVGNGETDIPMFQACGMGIGFNPLSEDVAKFTDVAIYKKDLREMLKYICDIGILPEELLKKI